MTNALVTCSPRRIACRKTLRAPRCAALNLGRPPRVDALLDPYMQAPWYKSPSRYRAYAHKYFVEVKPLLIKAGLAKG